MTRRAGRPVLKWAGGKTQLLAAILECLPKRIDTYFEPFIGGGAVFFALAREHRFEHAVIADKNADLVGVYLALQKDVDALIRKLQSFEHSEKEYYRVRGARPRGLVARAARVIYLNKTGYNGLYRVNRSGEFNVPFGRYKNPKICDEENLHAAARALEGVTILEADFEEVCARAKKGDAVYLDPPYVPVSKTSSFTAYDRHPFGQAEQQRLLQVFADLHARDVTAVLSNSFTPETEKLYEGWRAQRVKMARAINSRGSARGPVHELLVENRRSARVKRPRRSSRAA
jgi:DNA adenine methylase